MALFLVQHGKSLPKDVDPDQGLSVEGKAETERIANVAKDYGVNVKIIKHSVKTRARHTAEIFAAILKPDKDIQEITGIKPMDDVSAVAEKISSQDDVMLVGHLPFMERMTSHLITGTIEKPVLKFQNSGIVCLNQDPETKSWFIKWTLMPNIG
ncbi:MAG: phosphohistidine phosphatase SixA [Desulfobacteraceae bacterium]|jgi:phosphohistidine phosphatase